MEARYIVTNDQPYYPFIQYFDTIEEAKEEFERMIKEQPTEDCLHENIDITISMIIKTDKIKTY